MLFGIRRTPVESVRFKKKKRKEFRIRANKIFPQNSFSLHKIDSKSVFFHRIIYSTKLSTV